MQFSTFVAASAVVVSALALPAESTNPLPQATCSGKHACVPSDAQAILKSVSEEKNMFVGDDAGWTKIEHHGGCQLWYRSTFKGSTASWSGMNAMVSQIEKDCGASGSDYQGSLTWNNIAVYLGTQSQIP